MSVLPAERGEPVPGSPAQDPAGEEPERALAEGVPTDGPSPDGAAENETFQQLIVRLQRDYPDREAVGRAGDALPRALLEFAERHAERAGLAGNEALAGDVGRARQLAAEAYLVLGRRSEAVSLYANMASAGPLDSHRALALFVLGEDRFLREQYVSTGRRRAADYYWGILVQRFPQSEWAARVGRPVRYIGFLKGGQKAPAFEGNFEQAPASGQPAQRLSFSAQSLRGQVVLLEFWTADDAGRGERVQTLSSGLAGNLKQFPDLEGKVQALGVNLDTDRELFDAAIEAWGTPWPELHDGQGFRTPLAEAFAIPRAPHWVVIEAGGGDVVSIGTDFNRFLAAASQELRRVRGVGE